MPRYVRPRKVQPSLVKKRSVVVNGVRTSVSIEDQFWDVISRHSLLTGRTIASIVGRIDRTTKRGNLSSAIRLRALELVKAGEQ